MQYYDFQPDLTKAYPILNKAELILTDNVDPNMVQDIILKCLLPSAFSMLGTNISLTIVTVITVHDITYWDLIFEFPEYDEALPILDHITKASHDIKDSYDYINNEADHIYKLSFKIRKYTSNIN